jgi:hypothetical protein
VNRTDPQSSSSFIRPGRQGDGEPLGRGGLVGEPLGGGDAVGDSLGEGDAHDESLVNAIPFFLLTALFIGLPLLVLLALGKRGQTTLPKARDWMNANSWVVSEIVVVFFMVMELKDALAG